MVEEVEIVPHLAQVTAMYDHFLGPYLVTSSTAESRLKPQTRSTRMEVFLSWGQFFT